MNRLPYLRRAMRHLALAGTLACADASSPSTAANPVTPPANPVTPPANPATPPAPTGPRVIAVGEAVSGTITGAESECRFTTEGGGWGGLCHAFDIPVDASGILETNLGWSDDVPMTVFVKTAARTQIDMICCNGDLLSLAVPVEGGSRYRLEVAYAGRPRGYPQISPVSYSLITRLLPPDTSASATLRTILYADAQRTQRLSSGRVEIVDGPFAGTTATFDTIGGTYDMSGVPRGYVQIRASADLFLPVTVKVPIGVSVARGIELARSVPLADVSHSLAGMTWASPNTAYTGIKIEILDGPHAGVFTFSLDDWGSYEFRGLSPGRIRVRASREGLKPQTREVMVSGATILDFRW